MKNDRCFVLCIEALEEPIHCYSPPVVPRTISQIA